jgi:hypothetical protein
MIAILSIKVVSSTNSGGRGSRLRCNPTFELDDVVDLQIFRWISTRVANSNITTQILGRGLQNYRALGIHGVLAGNTCTTSQRAAVTTNQRLGNTPIVRLGGFKNRTGRLACGYACMRAIPFAMEITACNERHQKE